MNIEALAKQAGLEPILGSLRDGDDVWVDCDVHGGLEQFALIVAASERAACAALCEEVVTHPPGYGGQWEGYGPVKTQRDGKDCAAAIRARSNAKLSRGGTDHD